MRRDFLTGMIFLSAISLSAAPTCESVLSKSITTSEKCLNTLYQREAALDELMSDHKREIARLNALIAEKEKTIAMLQTPQSEVIKDSSKFDTIALPVETVLITKPENLDGKSLEERFKDIGNSVLLNDSVYRVSTHSSNVRNKPTSSDSVVVAYYQRGKVVEIIDVAIKELNGNQYYWIETDKGWIYVTDASNKEIRKGLDRLIAQKPYSTANATSHLAGEPAKGGGRS